MQFLNLHAGEHWCSTIKQFGCPSEYSTQHWEALHQLVKRKEKKSNHLQSSHDISRMIIEETTIHRALGDIEVYLHSHNSSQTNAVKEFAPSEGPVARKNIGEIILYNKLRQKSQMAMQYLRKLYPDEGRHLFLYTA
jgi:hypothetical protein